MSKSEEDTKKSKFSYKRGLSYSIGQMSDITSYQTFTFLIFTFYYAVVGISVILIMIGFIIWALWNSFNDFLIGYLSDRTHTKWGRRYPYIMFSIIPLALIMFFLFTPLFPQGEAYQIANFVYFLIIIIIFELFFTM